MTGADSSRGFLASYLDHHLRDGLAERTRCPVRVRSAGDDNVVARDVQTEPQPQEPVDHLSAASHLQ